MSRLVSLFILVGSLGCAGNRQLASPRQAEPASAPARAEFAVSSEYTGSSAIADRIQSTPIAVRRPAPAEAASPATLRSETPTDTAPAQSPVQTVGHHRDAPHTSNETGTLVVDGKQYRVELIEERDENPEVVHAGQNATADNQTFLPPRLEPIDSKASHVAPAPEPDTLPRHDVIGMNLPTALSLVGGQHPAVGFAQWRVQEAYAQLDRAEVLWLPSLQAGFSFNRHDGNFQAVNGSIVDVNRNSFQYGLGAGAVGAGTQSRPGLVARFHLADAIFQPQIAEKNAWAQGHAANGVVNEQLLKVAIAYLELLNAYQDAQILEESRGRTDDLAKLTRDFAATGQGLQADADRMATELTLVENRLVSARERADVASARLSQALSISADRPIAPLDPTVVPIDLISLNADKAALISTGLANRPELKESQALVAAACEQYRRQQYAPFVPSVLLGFSTGGFGGGLGNNLGNVAGRYDFDALMTWEVRNLGLGERAARQEAESKIQQAKFEKIRVMDQVAREVSESHAQIQRRAERITITRRAIVSAENSYQRNMSRIRDGQGIPLEVLQSVQALEDARRAYLSAVMDYNQAQFRLQWALGWPVNAPPVNAMPVPAPPAGVPTEAPDDRKEQ